MAYDNFDQNETASGKGKGKDLIKRANKAFSTAERYNAQKTWSLMAEFMLPSQNREWFGDVSKGIRRDRRVFDSTAIVSNRDLAAAIHSTVTNPAMHWSKLGFRDLDSNNDKDGRDWLDETSEVFHNTLNDSNFDAQVGTCYQALPALGNMVLFQDEDFTFYAWHLAEVALVENYRGDIDRVYRKFKMTAQQIIEKFGVEKAGEFINKTLENTPDMEFDIYHCIYPRDPEKVKINEIGLAGRLERPYESCYVLMKGARILEEDGYYEFPVFAVRWSKLPGEIYGFGPGNVALSDTRSINRIKEQYLNALAKTVNPPIITTMQNMISGDFRPSGITVVREMDGFKEFVTQSRFDVIQISIEGLQDAIKQAFYIDKLLLPPRTETGEMTAYEVQQRLQQMQQVLGPVLSRLNTEFLEPLVLRSLNILLRKKKIKPLPASLKTGAKPGKKASIDLDILFVNSLARSQQMSELDNVNSWVQEITQLAQAKPEALDKLDQDALVDYAAKIRAIPENLVKGDKEVDQIRQQRQQQQQAAQTAQVGEQGTSALKNLAQANAAGGQQGGGQGGGGGE